MIVLDCEQGSPEWFEARRGIPTASEFSRIVTPKTGQYSAAASKYIAELIAESIEPVDKWCGNHWTERGRELEAEARDWYQFQYDAEVQQVGMILHHTKKFAASPDGLISNDSGLEIKCPAPKTHVSWLMIGKVPDEHKPQIHGNMIATGRNQWEFVSYCPNFEPLVRTVVRDQYTAKVTEALAAFTINLEVEQARFLK